MEAVADEIAILLPRLRRFAHGLTHDPAEADRLAQATTAHILKMRAQRHPGTGAALWAYRVMRNLWIETNQTTAGDEGFAVGVFAVGGAHHELSRLMRTMGRLPEEQREAVALIMIEELSWAEAASVLDLPIGALISRLVRGRQALLAMLEE